MARQYSEEAEQTRKALFQKLRREYGFTWEELTKLTGMKLSERLLSK